MPSVSSSLSRRLVCRRRSLSANPNVVDHYPPSLLFVSRRHRHLFRVQKARVALLHCAHQNSNLDIHLPYLSHPTLFTYTYYRESNRRVS